MPRFVTSPAGEPVAIHTDEEWTRLVNGPKPLLLTAPRRAALAPLWCDGTIVDKSGLATRQYVERAQLYGYQPDTPTAVNQMLTHPAMRTAIQSTRRGKRTFELRLVALPESWCAQMPKPAREPDTEAAVADLTLVEPITPPEADEVEEPMEVKVASAVATALLTQVVEIIAAGQHQTDADWHAEQKVNELERDRAILSARLAQRLEENEKLRRSIRQAQDELVATQQERDGLRQRLKAAEYNLQRALAGDNQRLIMEEVHREIDRIMRAKPSSSKEDAA